jgi:hypothetical protein
MDHHHLHQTNTSYFYSRLHPEFKMQFSLSALAYICALVTFATASPFAIRDIASCEVAEAAQQVACIGGCANNAACITAW